MVEQNQKQLLPFVLEVHSNTKMSGSQKQVDLEKNTMDNQNEELATSSQSLDDEGVGQEERTISVKPQGHYPQSSDSSRGSGFKREVRRRVLHTTPSWFSVKSVVDLKYLNALSKFPNLHL